MPQKIDITNSTFIRLILILLALWFVYYIRDVFVLLFIVLIIVAGLTPTIDRWSRSITRPGAVISVFLIIFIILAAIFSLLVPPLVHQMQEFSTNLPNYANSINTQNNTFLPTLSNLVAKNVSQISSYIGDFTSLLFSKTVGLVSGVVAVITVIVLAFYLLIEEGGINKIYKSIIPTEYQEALGETTQKIINKLGAWIRGQLILMLAVGIAVAIGLFVIGSPYSLTLGLWSGLTEVIPILGPWIGAVPGVIIGLTQSPLQGVLAAIVFLVIQQLESNLLVPRVMSKAVGLNPVIVILALLIGGKLYGILGILLSVPMAATISVVVDDWSIIREIFSRRRSA